MSDPTAAAPSAPPPAPPAAPSAGPRVRLTTFPAPARWSTSGIREELTWEEAVEALRAADLWPGGGTIEHAHDRLPGWSFARYQNDSRTPSPGEISAREGIDRVEEVWGLVVEYRDDPTIDAREIQRRWGRYRFLAYTTAWHMSPRGEQPEGPRWHVLLPFSHAVSAADAQRLAAWARHPRMGAGLVHTDTSDPARWIARPALAPGGFEHAEGDEGAWLDPAAALRDLHQWRAADRLERARAVLAGTRLEELVAARQAGSEVTFPWPAPLGADPLRPGELVVLQAPAHGDARGLALSLCRAAGRAGHPVLHVATACTVDEVLARILADEEPATDWTGLRDPEDLAARARSLSQAAPDLHLWHPGPDDRDLTALAREWSALADKTGRPGLLVLDDPVDLAPAGVDLRRGLGLPLRDLAGSEGVPAAVVLVTDPATGAAIPADRWLDYDGGRSLQSWTVDRPRR